MPATTVRRKVAMNVRIDPAIVDAAKRAAEADGRSLTSWVARALDAAAKAALDTKPR